MPTKTNPTFEEVHPGMRRPHPVEGLNSPLEQQRAYIFSIESRPNPCPSCQQGVSKYMAQPTPAGDFKDEQHQCPFCNARLTFNVALFPIAGVWFWTLTPADAQAEKQGAG